MITALALLFFPAVLAMSLFRIYQLPRDLLSGTRWLNPEHRIVAFLASGATYLALGSYTSLIMYMVVGVIASPPQTLNELLSAASLVVGYPLVYLAYEWVVFYAIAPRSRR